MRVLLAAVALLVLASAEASNHLLGSQKCTWGPSYWCSGIPQSARCQATSHCIKKVWEKNPYPHDDDDVCTICKNMVKEARDTLESDELQIELKEVFEGSCALIPVSVIAKECKVLVDQFVPELVETLASEMNPDTVCSVAGLCNSKRIDKLLAKYYQESNERKSDCQVCKEESKKISKQIQEMDKNQVVDKLLEMCGYFNVYSDACKVTVLDNFDDIHELLIHLDSGLCELSGMCYGSSYSMASVNPQGDVQCEFCEKVIQHWIDTWTANTTEAEFKQVLEAMCHKMKPDKVQRCLHIVDDYYIPWFNYILHELNPSTACKIMGLCGSSAEFMALNPQSSDFTLLTSPRIKMTGQDEANAAFAEHHERLIGGYFAPQTAVEMSKPGCEICEYVMYELKKWLGDNKTEEAVEEGLDKVCSMLPSSLTDQCEQLVDTYGRAIVALIVQDVDPKGICTMLHLCDPPSNSNLASEDNPISALKKKDDECALCQYAIHTLFDAIEDKDNEDEIRNVLESLCSLMPSSIEDKCDDLVQKYSEKIIDMIIHNLTPEQICAGLQMCAAQKPKDTSCVLCEYVMQTLDEMLQNKTEQDEIKAAMEKICTYLPRSVSKQCTQFVDKYGDMVIDFVSHGVSPKEVCTQLGLCTETVDNETHQVEMLETVQELADRAEHAEGIEDRPYCTLCEYAIGEVDKLITDKKNEAEIKSVLDRICYELSAPIQKECVNMVTKYTDEIIDMFIQEYTPEQVCAELRLCKNGKHRFELSNESNQIPDMEHTEEEQKLNDSPLCVICEFAMSILEKQIITNRSLDMVERAVEMLCSYMPRTVEDKCDAFVDQYGDEIIRMIIEMEMDPKSICSALTLCTAAETMWDASSVGGHRCAFGPAFWCQSRFHAEACGTTQYCQGTVWKN